MLISVIQVIGYKEDGNLQIDEFGCYIGQGEKAYRVILDELFCETCTVSPQYPLGKLLKADYKKSMSDRQEKETIDFVVFRNNKKPIAIRVQDKRHRSSRMSNIDNAQKKILELNGCAVVDLWYNECVEMFKDEVNVNSREEIKKYVKPYL